MLGGTFDPLGRLQVAQFTFELLAWIVVIGAELCVLKKQRKTMSVTRDNLYLQMTYEIVWNCREEEEKTQMTLRYSKEQWLT